MPAILEIVTENDIKQYARDDLRKNKREAVKQIIDDDPKARNLYRKERQATNQERKEQMTNNKISANEQIEIRDEEVRQADRKRMNLRVLYGSLLVVAVAAVSILVFY